jgi:Secretion system C-terminal sorting domain
MKRFFRSMAVVAATILVQSADAQVWQLDSVNLAPTIKRDVWYSMDNGQVKSDTANNWTLAVTEMSMTGGVWLNNIDGYRCINVHKSASQFANVTAADSLTGTEQVNPDYSWERGAMNVNRAAADTFDFGWGKYNLGSNNVYGDSVYLIGKGANWYKVIIDSLIGSTYTYYMRVAAVAPFASPAASLNFPKGTTFANKNLQFIQAGMTGLSSVDREPANTTWDILFTKYLGLVNSQGGPAIYPVTGALSNYKTEVARVQAVHLDTAFAQANSYPRRKELSVIGSDWKIFNGAGYDYPDSLSYMVKAKSGDIWQLKFTGYSSSTGFIKFKKRKVFATANNNIEAAEMNMQVYPNPAQNEALVSVEAKQSTKAILVVTSTTGQLIASRNIELTQGINAFNLNLSNIATGNYNISVKGAGINLTKMLIKQ